MKITTYKYVKEAVSDTELELPQEPLYCFETGIRRAIRVVPCFIRLKHEFQGEDMDLKQIPIEPYIYKLEITCVYQSFECKIEKFQIQISQIESIYGKKEPSREKSIIELLLSKHYNERSKEDFENDLNNTIKKINETEL